MLSGYGIISFGKLSSRLVVSSALVAWFSVPALSQEMHVLDIGKSRMSTQAIEEMAKTAEPMERSLDRDPRDPARSP